MLETQINDYFAKKFRNELGSSDFDENQIDVIIENMPKFSNSYWADIRKELKNFKMQSLNPYKEVMGSDMIKSVLDSYSGLIESSYKQIIAGVNDIILEGENVQDKISIFVDMLQLPEMDEIKSIYKNSSYFEKILENVINEFKKNSSDEERLKKNVKNYLGVLQMPEMEKIRELYLETPYFDKVMEDIVGLSNLSNISENSKEKSRRKIIFYSDEKIVYTIIKYKSEFSIPVMMGALNKLFPNRHDAEAYGLNSALYDDSFAEYIEPLTKKIYERFGKLVYGDKIEELSEKYILLDKNKSEGKEIPITVGYKTLVNLISLDLKYRKNGEESLLDSFFDDRKNIIHQAIYRSNDDLFSFARYLLNEVRSDNLDIYKHALSFIATIFS